MRSRRQDVSWPRRETRVCLGWRSGGQLSCARGAMRQKDQQTRNAVHMQCPCRIDRPCGALSEVLPASLLHRQSSDARSDAAGSAYRSSEAPVGRRNSKALLGPTSGQVALPCPDSSRDPLALPIVRLMPDQNDSRRACHCQERGLSCVGRHSVIRSRQNSFQKWYATPDILCRAGIYSGDRPGDDWGRSEVETSAAIPAPAVSAAKTIIGTGASAPRCQDSHTTATRPSILRPGFPSFGDTHAPHPTRQKGKPHDQ